MCVRHPIILSVTYLRTYADVVLRYCHGIGAQQYPRWDGSEAARLLKLDIEAGEHLKLTPVKLHEKRVEYKALPLHVFRDHIYQEKRSRMEGSYWKALRSQEKES